MKYLIFCLVLLVFSPVYAQEAEPAPPLSLQQVLDIALKNQIDVKVAENNVIAAKSRADQAKASYFPQVSVQNNTFVSGSGVLTQRNTGTALAVTQNIYDGGVREANISGSRHRLTASQAGKARTVQSVVFDVTQSYYEVLRAKKLADVAEASVKYNESLREVVQSQVDVGERAQVDLLPVEAQLANARVNLLAAQNAVQVAKIRLQNSMGLSPQPDFDVKDVDEQPLMELQPIEVYLAEADANRPDIAQAKASVGAANASVRASRIALYPIPRITAEYQNGLGGLEGSSTQIFGGISFNLFDGGRNRAAFREAQANRTIAEQQSQQLTKDIQAQVRQAYLNLNNSLERLNASQVGFDAAQKNYEAQQARYEQGLAIPLDLLNAEVQVVTAQTNLVQARYDYYIAMAQMEFAVGKNGGTNED